MVNGSKGSFWGLDLDSGSYSYISENSREINKSTMFEDFQHNSVLVIPETVGQYTGLTDKNGKRIFEGDILTLENEGIYAAVKYNESKAAFYVEDEDHEDYLGEAWKTNVIIIGNIHDNTEILKGGGDNG